MRRLKEDIADIVACKLRGAGSKDFPKSWLITTDQ